jgi:hypothetical protein
LALAGNQEFNRLFRSDPVSGRRRVEFSKLRDGNLKVTNPHDLGYSRGFLDALDYISSLPGRMAEAEVQKEFTGQAAAAFPGR